MKNFLLVLGTLAVSAIIGEGVIRAFLGDVVYLFPRYHAEAQYGDFTIRRLRPETTFWHTSVDGSWKFVVNQQGFRDEQDLSYDKEENVLRVITLGDSHTLGFEVRQDRTYAAVMEEYLSRQGLRAEVINAGVSGFSTAEEMVLLENEAIKYDPDVVVVGFFANDFHDNIKADLFRLEDGTLSNHKKAHAPAVKILRVHNAIWPMRWLSENSYLYSLLLNTAWEIGKAMILSRKQADLATEIAVATTDIDDYQKRLALRLLERMRDFSRARSIAFIIVDIPQATTFGDFSSSIPDDLLSEFEQASDGLITSEEVLSPFRGVAEFHLPHGQAHISEFTHLMLGIQLAQRVQGIASAP